MFALRRWYGPETYLRERQPDRHSNSCDDGQRVSSRWKSNLCITRRKPRMGTVKSSMPCATVLYTHQSPLPSARAEALLLELPS